MKIFALELGVHCEFFESSYGQTGSLPVKRARYTSDFAKWLEKNNIKVAMHNFETLRFTGGPWIIFKEKDDEMLFKLAWI